MYMLTQVVFDARAAWLANKGACDPGAGEVLEEYNDVLSALWKVEAEEQLKDTALRYIADLRQEQEHARRVAAGLPLKKEGELYV
jgi:hypothetical protein